MKPEEQAIIDKAASKQAAIKATINKKPQARYRISVVATFLDDAGKDPARLNEVAATYLKQCGMTIIALDVKEAQKKP